MYVIYIHIEALQSSIVCYFVQFAHDTDFWGLMEIVNIGVYVDEVVILYIDIVVFICVLM